MRSRSKIKQSGLSLVGFIFLLAIGGILAVLGMKIAPTVAEYFSVKKAIVQAQSAGENPLEIRRAFDRQAQVSYITSVSGKDLSITQSNGIYEVGFAYEKVIPLFGPASLLLEYEGNTGKTGGRSQASQ